MSDAPTSDHNASGGAAKDDTPVMQTTPTHTGSGFAHHPLDPIALVGGLIFTGVGFAMLLSDGQRVALLGIAILGAALIACGVLLVHSLRGPDRN